MSVNDLIATNAQSAYRHGELAERRRILKEAWEWLDDMNPVTDKGKAEEAILEQFALWIDSRNND
jgi:hypothetical protein